jgi:PLP dependent protein
MKAIEASLQAVKARIEAAARLYGRDPDGIGLLAVSKTRPAADVLAAVAGGQRAFGENYLQEGVDKIADVRAELGAGAAALCWHFIGPLQSNKTRLVAENFDWVHSLDRLKVAERLSAQRPVQLPPLQVCVQVNISGEESKSGCLPAAAAELCAAVAQLPRLRLRGLMAVPAPAADFEAQCLPLGRLRELLADIKRGGLPLDTLSMGMTHDLEAAVAEGSTMVRIGTAIFGERNYR